MSERGVNRLASIILVSLFPVEAARFMCGFIRRTNQNYPRPQPTTWKTHKVRTGDPKAGTLRRIVRDSRAAIFYIDSNSSFLGAFDLIKTPISTNGLRSRHIGSYNYDNLWRQNRNSVDPFGFFELAKDPSIGPGRARFPTFGRLASSSYFNYSRVIIIFHTRTHWKLVT